MASVLVATARTPLRETIGAALAASGLSVCPAATTGAAIRAAVSLSFDAAVVDTRLASTELLATLDGTPLIAVATAEESWSGKTPWAAEVLAEPVDAEELRRAVTSSIRGQRVPVTDIVAGPLTLRRESHRVEHAGAEARLTQIEFKLLEYLARTPGTVASVDQLLRDVWGYSPEVASSDVIRSHVKNLRRKLQPLFPGTAIVETIPRLGYRLNA